MKLTYSHAEPVPDKTSLVAGSLPTSGLLADITNIPQDLLEFYTNFAFRVRRGWRTLVRQMRNSGNGIFRNQSHNQNNNEISLNLSPS